MPAIGAGSGLIVTAKVLKQPEASVNVMRALPADTPVTTPDAVPTFATAVLLLDHDPVPEQVKSADSDTHIAEVPVIEDGSGFTETLYNALQPPGIVYDTITDPEAMPEMVPDAEPAMAIAGLLLAHVPPVVPS